MDSNIMIFLQTASCVFTVQLFLSKKDERLGVITGDNDYYLQR